MSLVLGFIYWAYQADKDGLAHQVKRPVKNGLDFAMFPLATILEPVEIPWFRVGSAGMYCIGKTRYKNHVCIE